jgi:PBP1b-binding outer membrane lipoprotein LpoB
MSPVIKRTLIVVAALALVLTGCSTSAVPADDVATEAERVLAEQMGEVEVECPDDLAAEIDETITCTVTVVESDQTLDMTATVTTVEGDDVSMEFEFPDEAPPAE